MLKSYFTSAFRHLCRNRAYTLINTALEVPNGVILKPDIVETFFGDEDPNCVGPRSACSADLEQFHRDKLPARSYGTTGATDRHCRHRTAHRPSVRHLPCSLPVELPTFPDPWGAGYGRPDRGA